MDFTFNGVGLRHRETLEKETDQQEHENVVEDGVEFILVLETLENPNTGQVDYSFASVWRQRQEGEGTHHDEGFELKKVKGGEPEEIENLFETWLKDLPEAAYGPRPKE